MSLPWQAELVVRASRELTGIEKLVWCEDRGLDLGPAGCFLGAGPLADRLGRSRDTIERARRELVRLGLHKTRSRGVGTTASWYVMLPHDVMPSSPAGAQAETWRPDPALVRRLADGLDGHVRAIRGPRREETGGRITATPEAEVAAAPPPVAGQVAAIAPRHGGIDAARSGGSSAPGVAAAVPLRSSSSSRRSAKSSGDEYGRVAHATAAESENSQDRASRDSVVGGLRCERCRRPLETALSGRLKLCPCQGVKP